MEELVSLLNGVEDSYFDFVSAMIHYAGKKESRMHLLVKYMKENPNSKSFDIVKFVSNQKDFMEDAAFMRY